MAGKRNTKSQARRNSGGDSTAIPGGVWMLVGLGLAIALFLFAPKFLDGRSANDFFRPKPNAEAQPPAIDATSDKAPIAQDTSDRSEGRVHQFHDAGRGGGSGSNGASSGLG